MGTDYKVRFRTYDQVGEAADDLRAKLGLANAYSFNIVKQIRRLIGKTFSDLGALSLHLYDDGSEFAFVTFNPLVLHVDKNIWEEAEMGEPKARFVLAHELGHIVMHGHYRQEFSANETAGLTFFPPEERSEPQAHWFAAHFLAPDRLVLDCRTEFEISEYFGFPSEYIYLKREALARRRVKLPSELCGGCGGSAMAGDWLPRKCSVCGWTGR